MKEKNILKHKNNKNEQTTLYFCLMILIVDSGSTKTDWLAINTKSMEQFSFETIGFNPMIQTEEFIQSQISLNKDLINLNSDIINIYFFGAGCSTSENNNKVINALKANFPTSNILVDHDLNGALIALCQGNPGIACILGTGSNSIFFDGVHQQKKVPSLGFILGDEGSGAYFGKQLLRDFLYGNLPNEIFNYMSIELDLNKDIILQKIYGEPNPNRYLASFAIILSHFRQTDYVQKLLLEGFNSFFQIHILCFEKYREIPLNFVGSIAINFKSEIEIIANKYQCKIGRFVQKPIQAIAEYYLSIENA